MVSSLSIVSFLINRASLEFLKQDLYKTTAAFQELLQNNEQELKLVLNNLSQTLTWNASDYASTGHEWIRLFDLDYLVIEDQNKGIRFIYPERSDWLLDTSPNFLDKKDGGLIVQEKSIYQVVGTRVPSGGQILAAKKIDDHQARTIKKIANGDITILLKDEVSASTITNTATLIGLKAFYNRTLAARHSLQNANQKPIQIGEESFLINFEPIVDINGHGVGYAAIQRSTERIMNFNRDIKNTLLVIIVVFWLCTGLVVVLFMQRHLVQPITQLATAVDAIAKGDLSPSLEIQSNDELGVLYSGFNHMASEVRSWTGQLQEKNKELEKHSHRIEEINQEMQDFVYVVSHDLKSPLVNIQGFTGRLHKLFRNTRGELEELQRESGPIELSDTRVERVERLIKQMDDKAPQSFDFINTASAKMNGMIEELLGLSRVETRNMPLEATDIGQEVESIIKAAKYEIQEKNIEVQIDPMPTVVCEQARINQVLSNLITNAIKFIGDQPNKKIHVGYEAQKDLHLFFVRDNGVGIDAKDHKKIFRVFYRGDTKVSGHGMGLALAKKIITKHGGHIWLESELGKGTTFYFTIKKNHAQVQEQQRILSEGNLE